MITTGYLFCYQLFSGVFGIGPSTAKKWIEKGWSTIREAQQGHTSGDWRVNWGMRIVIYTCSFKLLIKVK